MIYSQKRVDTALQQISQKYPDATDNGLDRRAYFNHDSPKHYIGNELFLKEVNTVACWLQMKIDAFGVVTSINTGISSYLLKHLAEEWGREQGLQPYVCNMAAIVACWLHPEIKLLGTPNPCINLSKRLLRK